MILFFRLKDKFWIYVAAFFLLIFPVSIISLPHIHGLVILVSLFMGVYFCTVSNECKKTISINERWFYFSVSFMVTAAFFVALMPGVGAESLKGLGKFLYLLMAIPVYLFFRKINIRYTYFWYGLVFGSFVSAGIAIYYPQDPVDLFRAGGILNPIIFGDLALLLGVMSLAGVGWFRSKAHWQMFIPIIAFYLALLASVLSQSRGGWLAVPFVFIIFFWYSGRAIDLWKRVVATMGLIVLLFSLYLIPQTGVEIKIATSVENFTEYVNSDSSHWSRDTSIGARLESWKASWRIFLENPLVGVGWGNYQENARVFIEAGLYHKSAGYYNHPHNQYFSSMVSGGALGLLATLALFIIPIMIFIRVIKSPNNTDDARRIALAGLIMVVGFAVFNLTESFLERSRPVAFFLFYLAVCMAGIHKKINNDLIQSENKT